MRRPLAAPALRTRAWLQPFIVLATLAMSQAPAIGQALTEPIIVTGTAIRRVDTESARPVLSLQRADIERSGATSTTDLLNQLSIIQGSTRESLAEGAETYGFTGVSIHNVGEGHTLVLLNGHRLAAFGGQTLTGFGAGFDLNAIPLSMLERIDILSDGASALYGADAIAGVVNFITRRDVSEGELSMGYSSPRSGAKAQRLSATKGLGALDAEGFNVLMSVNHDERTALHASDRSFADTGRRAFSLDGRHYLTRRLSAYPIPANVVDADGKLINPYQKANGNCPGKSFRIVDGSDDYCAYDYVQDLDIYPSRQRDMAMGAFTKKLGRHELFIDILTSRATQGSRISPAYGDLTITAGSPLFNQYLAPLGFSADTPALYRLADLDARTTRDTSTFHDLAMGANGQWSGWDYRAAWTWSRSAVKTESAGYPGALALNALVDAGLINPFLGPGQQSPAGMAALQHSNYRGYWNGGTSMLSTWSLSGSRALMSLPTGPLLLGTGINLNTEKLRAKPSLFAQGLLADPVAGTLCDPGTQSPPCDQRSGDASATAPFAAARTSYGVFGELVIPATKALELTSALRHDRYSDFGHATSAMGSFKLKADQAVLVRGSLGTGFRAPTLPQVHAASYPYGQTAGAYDCTAALLAVAQGLGAQCQPGTQTYDVIAGGNARLKPEKSVQGTLGLRVDPSPRLSLGADLWHVEIRNAVGQLSSDAAFANPALYPQAWGTSHDAATNTTYLAFLMNNQNLGKSYATGLDFDLSGRARTEWGLITSRLTATYMIREVQKLDKNGPYYSAIGNDNPMLEGVTFRWQGRWVATLANASWAHTLSLNFKSGYTDRATLVDVVDAQGQVTGTDTVKLPVHPYTTCDWQSTWAPAKGVTLTMGVLNVLDTKPPLVVSAGDAGRSLTYGYDDRYVDPRGRTLYVNGTYRF